MEEIMLHFLSYPHKAIRWIHWARTLKLNEPIIESRKFEGHDSPLDLSHHFDEL
jgi:hypothetical protein